MATNHTEEEIPTGHGLIPARLYSGGLAGADAPVVLHLHGGAFVGGSLETARTIPALLAEAGAIVVSAEYPLAPQYTFPYALKVAFQALTWLHKGRAKWAGRKSSVYVAGEEAGGNLAAGLALMARDQHEPPLAGQILLSPMLDPCLATCSMREAAAGPVGCMWADGWHQYLGSADKAAHPYASPLESSRLSGLAPALLVTAEDDLLRDESLRYARRLREAGVRVATHVLAGPTGWPCALNVPDVERVWAPAIRGQFRKFFADTKAALQPASSLHPIED